MGLLWDSEEEKAAKARTRWYESMTERNDSVNKIREKEIQLRENELKMKEKAQTADIKRKAISEYQVLAEEGTVSAYMRIYKASDVEGPNGLEYDEVEQLLSGFAYTRVPGEFAKIVVFLKKEKDESALKELKVIADMNANDPAFSQAAKEIDEYLKEAERKRKVLLKRTLVIVLPIIAVILLLGLISSMVQSCEEESSSKKYRESEMYNSPKEDYSSAPFSGF